jgi:hypothetical protein
LSYVLVNGVPCHHLGHHRGVVLLARLPHRRLGHRSRVPRVGRLPKAGVLGGADPAGDAPTLSVPQDAHLVPRDTPIGAVLGR